MSSRAPRRLQALASAVGAVALVAVGLVIGVLNEVAFQARQAQSLTAQAQVLAATVQPAIIFLDSAAAQEAVGALAVDRRIEAAEVYNSRGERVAVLRRGREGLPLRGSDGGAGRQRGRLTVAAPVISEARRIGVVYLRAAPEPLTALMQRHGGAALLLLMAMIVLAGVLASLAAQTKAARESEARASELRELNARLQLQIERRETAEDALRQAQKMETLGQLTGGIAHDFNNLLQTVQGALDLILRKPEDHDRVRKWARMALEAAERGARLTSQLLAFSRSQKLEMRPVDVRQVLQRMRDLLPTTLGAGVEIAFDDSAAEPWVLADETQLDLAILNLCINARDAMPNGGLVRVSTRTVSLADDPELAAADYLVLAVADSGVGMPDDVRARAFDPFYTTKGVGKGTGLGLAQVYGIAKQAGGVARIDSAAGQGTCVSIFLPTTTGVAPPAASRIKAFASAAASARILVVDDDVGVRSYVCEVLTSLGHQCIQASDGAAGLEILSVEPVDLLIVDYAMPGLSGAQVAEAALAQRPGLPIIFASGYADSKALETAMGRPVELLRKPFTGDTLKARIGELLSSPGPAARS